MSTISSPAGWCPSLMDASDERCGSWLQQCRSSALTVHDTLPAQLMELIETRNPGMSLPPEQLERRALELAGGNLDRHGTWVFYPWSARLVRLLPAAEFQELRTSRNRNKIRLSEQQRLAELRIGVVGLSVGQTTATALAMEGIGGEFRLADFDTVSLSNLNRLRCGVHDLGTNKAVVTARQILELNPYLTVRVFESGITTGNIEEFLGRPAPLNLLFEQCDDLATKLRLREHARRLRLPVVMDTNDRGLLDIERFDQEPARPLLHGLLGGLSADDIATLPPAQRLEVILKLVGGEVSPRMAESMAEIGKTLKTWPQLASDVELGAALNVEAARKLALGLIGSGRFSVDLDRLIQTENATLTRR